MFASLATGGRRFRKGIRVSLKAFHVVFVVVSTLLCLGFGAWAVREYRVGGDAMFLAGGVFSFVLAAALLVYGGWFLRKLRGVGYL